MGQILIAGFSSTDKRPGFYGEIKYGTGAQSASSIPLLLLLVGLAASDASQSAVANTELVDVYSDDDAEAAFKSGTELSCMCYDALAIEGVQIKAICVANAGGAVAASATITFAGTPTATGTWQIKIGGKLYTGTITASDTATTIATAVRDAINQDTKCPLSATSALGVVTCTSKSTGARGNQHIIRKDDKLLAAGVTCAIAGGTALASGGVPLTGGTGVETYTTLLATLRPSGFDRIALAANDATSLAAWETQLDAQAGPTEGLHQQVVLGANGTLTAAQSVAQTTLNNPLFQLAWNLNGETHPSRVAAQFAALRTQTEQSDPAAAFDGAVLPSVAPQQRADWPTHATIVSALNTGVTPVTTGPDGKARVERSITTKSLTGTTPDYRTLDTAEVTVPQFVFKDLKLGWQTEFLPSNPRCAADPAEGERPRASGVATPSMWNSYVEAKLRRYEQGDIGGVQIAPIIIDVDTNKPFSTFDSVAERIMSAVPLKVAPANHQVGVSVRGK